MIPLSLWRDSLCFIRTHRYELFYLLFGTASLSVTLSKLLGNLLPAINHLQPLWLAQVNIAPLLVQSIIAPLSQAVLLSFLQQRSCHQETGILPAVQQGLLLYYWPLLLLDWLFNVLVSVGLLLCVVPGVILTIRWSLAATLLVHQRQSIGSSLKLSWQYTAQSWWLVVAGYWPIILLHGLLLIGLSTLAPCLPADLWSWQLLLQTLHNLLLGVSLIYRFRLTMQCTPAPTSV